MKKRKMEDVMKFVKPRRKVCKRAILVLGLVAVNFCLTTMPVFASSPSSGADLVTTKIGLLFDIIAAFVSSYGGIQVLWGVFEWGNATNTQDGMMQSMAVKRIGGGLVEVIASQLVAVLIA